MFIQMMKRKKRNLTPTIKVKESLNLLSTMMTIIMKMMTRMLMKIKSTVITRNWYKHLLTIEHLF